MSGKRGIFTQLTIMEKDKTVEDIKSDELVEMTESFHRAFNTHGCDPMCHCCEKDILPKQSFKLATVETRKRIAYMYPDFLKDDLKNYDNGTESISKEVMLCDKCTPDQFKKVTIEKMKVKIKAGQNLDERKRGCFRINGKIVH